VPLESAIEEYTFTDSVSDDERTGFKEEFMQSCCRVLLQIERSKVLENLKTEAEFLTQVADHDDGAEAARKRLQHVREAA
jgi:hypothetical protein